ncbi:MAG: YfbR-like 5'-deoxynucleotidase [Nitrospiraceae bacterium]
MDFDRIDRIRKGGHVKRYHTHQCHHPGTVADHSWFVAWLAGELWRAAYKTSEAPTIIYRYALEHDLAEFDTGDAPGWAKAAWKSMREGPREVEDKRTVELELHQPDEITRSFVKAADQLDVLFWALEERRMGNANALIIFVRTSIQMRRWLETDIDTDLFKAVREVRRDLIYEMRKLDPDAWYRTFTQVEEHEDYYSKLGATV